MERLENKFARHVTWAEHAWVELDLTPQTLAELHQMATKIRRRISDRNLYIAVVGEFNSGKSTFINTLLRDPLLPMAPVVATSTATQLRHGAKLDASFEAAGTPRLRRVRVGNAKSSRPTAFEKYLRDLVPTAPMPTTQRQGIAMLITDETVSRTISNVLIDHPAELLAQNIVIVDTPGLNATDETHTTIVNQVVAETADLAAVLVPANAPVSSVLVDFVRSTLSKHIGRCIFIVTKLDQVPDDERAPLLSSIRRRLTRAGAKNPVVRPCGGRNVLDQLLRHAPPDPMTDQFLALEGELAERAARQHSMIVSVTINDLVSELVTIAKERSQKNLAAIRAAQRQMQTIEIQDLQFFIASRLEQVRGGLEKVATAEREQIEKEKLKRTQKILSQLRTELDACQNLATLQDFVSVTAPDIVSSSLRSWVNAHAGFDSRLGETSETEIRRVYNDFGEQFSRLEKVANRTNRTFKIPKPREREPQALVVADFSVAMGGVDRSVAVRNWTTGGTGLAGALLGSFLVPIPFVGTAAGGWLGGAIGRAATNRAPKVRERVREPLVQGAKAAVSKTADQLCAALDSALETHYEQCEMALHKLESAGAGPLKKLIKAQQERGNQLSRAYGAASAIRSQASARLAEIRRQRDEAVIKLISDQ
jgi:tRNA U34 5-carboxymethylaminomethyl modifying GTPase MnmE/TrmE